MKFLPQALICLLVGGVISTAQAANDDANMTPPKPLENKVLDSMVGTWVGQSDMMGTPMRDTVKISWTLNHQFIKFDLHSEAPNNPTVKYDGMGMFGVEDNQSKAWWFDSWGAKSVAMGSGTFTDNTLKIADSNKTFKETRSFTVKGNELTMIAKGSMVMNGKEMPFEQTVIYKKQ